MGAHRVAVRRNLRHPARIVALAFLVALAIGTALMMLPACRAAAGGGAPFITALFTATSAICVVGLTVVDTPHYWSQTGLVLITILTQIGGLGIVTLASLTSLIVSRRLGLRSRLVTQVEASGLTPGDLRRMITQITIIMAISEVTITLILALRLWGGYDYPPGKALWYGLFHAVQSYNNGGMSLYSDSLIGFVGDWWVCLPLALGVIIGGLGFPAVSELLRQWRHPAAWSVHTKLTIWGSLTLLAIGFAFLLLSEWRNAQTLGPLDASEKVLAAFTENAMARSAGFESVHTAALNGESIIVLIVLMFIGGGSASTAGGIRVSTFFLLAFVIWAELRGEPDVVIGRRRISPAAQRQALTVALLSVALVMIGSLVLIWQSGGFGYYQAVFSVTSAFSTTGLSLGTETDLPAIGKLALVILMYVGRVGTIAIGSAIALNTRHRLYRYPEERPIVG